MIGPSRASRRGRSFPVPVAILAIVSIVAASDGRPSGAAEIRNAGISAGIRAYQEGDYERAEELLEEGLREGLRSLAEAGATFAPSDPRVISLRLEVLEGWKHLAFARTALGEEAKAGEAFGKALDLDPDLALDPSTTSPKILEVFLAVQEKGTSRKAPGWKGPLHRPPLFCVKGNPVTLYVRLESGERVEDFSLVYSIGSPAGEPFHLRVQARSDDLARWEIPAGVTLGGRDIYYHFEEEGVGGRVRASPWIPLVVISSLPELGDRLPGLRSEYVGPEVEAAVRAEVEVLAAPVSGLPPGISSVDSSARALRERGGLLPSLGALLGEK